MTDHPIIFSAPMVRALLDGRKTMTRRLAWREIDWPEDYTMVVGREVTRPVVRDGQTFSGLFRPTPWQRMKPGDRVWVRESLAYKLGMWWYAADDSRVALIKQHVAAGTAWAHHYSRDSAPSIHMPRALSRLTLIVTATRIERLQDISEDDAIAEGVERQIAGNGPHGVILTFRTGFVRLWGQLHGTDSWLSNPEVVALTFTVHQQNIDAIPKEDAA